jgi:DNA-directed RNA polymerase subunit N (RpoN/RPB10)
MKINCVSCGHKVDLDDMYEDYAGQIKCFACGAMLEIKLEAGKPKSISLARPQADEEGVIQGAPVGREGPNYA